MQKLPDRYNHELIEYKITKFWLDNNYFYSNPDYNRQPYTIVIPPPNVTGILHMGHILNNTIQDVLARRARMQGYNVCWVPGTDHASIATESKIVSLLKNENKSKYELGREDFVKYTWKWAKKHISLIREQLQKLGCSCDWRRICFTLDKKQISSVTKAFIYLYKKGLIYRGYRMVYWDPEARTTISNEEVIYKEIPGTLYYIKYPLIDEDNYLVITTTRPETILGDLAICIHPLDKRYLSYKGKKVLVPLVSRIVPILEDEYVDREFGTGCLKITPAHDLNDNCLATKHNLQFIDIFNDDCTINENGGPFKGKTRFEARQAIIQELKQKKFLVNKKSIYQKIGISERTGVVIEPRRSRQWFLKTKSLAKDAISAVINGQIRFYPEKYTQIYHNWMVNIHDWNISRQLWWGHRIPVYYYGPGIEDYVVGESLEEALILVRNKTGKKYLPIELLKQDEDVLDTWFCSWLWPISVFDGISKPENEDIKYYYPTTDLVTAPDILFFWVARMIMSGYAFRGEKPFESVYLTGIVRDKQRKKMSKSLGNSPNPIALIKKYSSDGVRLGLLLSTRAGNDMLFHENLCLQGRNFTTKLWNAFRLIKNWEIDDKKKPAEADILAIKWFENCFYEAFSRIESALHNYKISEALNVMYKLTFDDFCSWYLEIIKPNKNKSTSKEVYLKTVGYIKYLLKILHPYIPFITEEIWQYLSNTSNTAIIISCWPTVQPFNSKLLAAFEQAKHLVSKLRYLRKNFNFAYKVPLDVFTSTYQTFDPVIIKLANLSEINYLELKISKPRKYLKILVGTKEYFIFIPQHISYNELLASLNKDIQYYKNFFFEVQKKLFQKNFIANAPANIISIEHKKANDLRKKIYSLQAYLESIEF